MTIEPYQFYLSHLLLGIILLIIFDDVDLLHWLKENYHPPVKK